MYTVVYDGHIFIHFIKRHLHVDSQLSADFVKLYKYIQTIIQVITITK